MQNKQTFWILSGIASLAAGILSLYASVKIAALRLLEKQGAFESADKERQEALDALHPITVKESTRFREKVVQYTPHDEAEMQKINNRWHTKRRNIIQNTNADTFSGAWNILPAPDRNKCLGFAAVTSVASGAALSLLKIKKVRSFLDRAIDWGADTTDYNFNHNWLDNWGHHGGHHGGGFGDFFDGGGFDMDF
jgi:hypothetical protein